MNEEILLSTAYFPPAEYFSLVASSGRVLIEREENYHKQTYRNRCIIMTSGGALPLVVPVLRGSFHKTAIKDLRIDNSRRWRDLHLRSIISAYAAAPFFEYYIDIISGVISKPYNYLLDLNKAAFDAMCGAIGLTAETGYTDHFEPEGRPGNDYRYSITPKGPSGIPGYASVPYTQVFSERHGFIPRLSIIDILLNNGPGTRALLLRSLEADNC
ncbi:MAG: WbqC family protein [Bacteroidales bacterium]|jgi:hypothetical protein|nr:WbqC family protein [Bacteroidales bacterium]